MKTLSSFNQTSIDNPNVDLIRLVKIDFDGLILYLCDRTWGDSGAKCIFNGQIYEPLIVSWGTVDQGSIDPNTFRYSPGQASFSIDNTMSVGGYDCFTTIFGDYKPHKATVTLSQIFNGATVADDEIQEWEGKIGELPVMKQSIVGISCIGYDLSIVDTFRHDMVSIETYPGADPDDVGKMLSIVYGSAKKVPFRAVDAGSMTTTIENLDASETIIDVSEVEAFPTSGTIQIDDEKIDYTGKTATQFTGCTRGVDGTSAEIHNLGATVAEIQTEYVFLMEHSVVSIDNVYVENRTSTEFVRQDSALYTLYTGKTGDENADYPGKACIVFNTLPSIGMQINIEAVDTIDVDDSIAVSDPVHGHTRDSEYIIWNFEIGRDLYPYSSNINDPESLVSSFDKRCEFLGLPGEAEVSKAYYETHEGAPAQYRICMTTHFHFHPTHGVRFTFGGQSITRYSAGTVKHSWGTVPSSLNTWEEFTNAIGTVELITAGGNVLISQVWVEIFFTPTVDSSISGVSKSGAAVKTGTVTLTGNSVADTVIGGMVCADVQGQPADDSGNYGDEDSLVERPDYILKHILVDRCNLSINKIDTSAYDISGVRYTTYFINLSVVLLERPNVRNLVYDISRQSRSLAFWSGGQHKLVFMEPVEMADKELIGNRIDAETTSINYTNQIDIKNVFSAIYNKEWSGATKQDIELFSGDVIFRHEASIVDYAEKIAPQIEFPYIIDETVARTILSSIGNNLALPREQIKPNIGHLVDVEIGDVVSFIFSTDDNLDKALLKLVSSGNRFRVLKREQLPNGSIRIHVTFILRAGTISYANFFYGTDDGYDMETVFYPDLDENLLGGSEGATTSTSTSSSSSSSTASTVSTMSTTSSTASSSSSSSTASSSSTSSSTMSTASTTSSSSTVSTSSTIVSTSTTINPCDMGYGDANLASGGGAGALTSSDNPSYDVYNAFDGNINTYWKALSSGFPQWIQVETDIERTIGKLVIKTDSTQFTYHPTSFDLKVSTTGVFGGEEITLLSHTGVVWSSEETKEWWFENGTAYRYYRLYHNGNAAGEYAAICEMEMYQCNSFSTTTTSSSSSTSSTASSSSTSSTASTTSSSSSTASTVSTNTQSSTTSSSSSTASTTHSSSSTSSTASTTHSSTSTVSTISTTSTMSTTSSTASSSSTMSSSSTNSSSSSSTTTTTARPQNDFSSDSSCKAVWNFEPGNLLVDSKGSNTLSNTGATEDTENFIQGSGSADKYAASSLYVNDADLDSGFPLKNGDAVKRFTFCCWFNHTDSEHFYLISKHNTNQYCFRAACGQSATKDMFLTFGYNFGNDQEVFSNLFDGVIERNRWFHIGITYRDDTGEWTARLWDDSIQTAYFEYGTVANEINVGDSAPFQVCSYGPYGLDGNVDEFVVFNRVLGIEAIDAIRQGTYSGVMTTTTTTTTA